MSYIITSIISAMVGGMLGLFVGCACALAGRGDKMKNNGEKHD